MPKETSERSTEIYIDDIPIEPAMNIKVSNIVIMQKQALTDTLNTMIFPSSKETKWAHLKWIFLIMG